MLTPTLTPRPALPTLTAAGRGTGGTRTTFRAGRTVRYIPSVRRILRGGSAVSRVWSRGTGALIQVAWAGRWEVPVRHRHGDARNSVGGLTLAPPRAVLIYPRYQQRHPAHQTSEVVTVGGAGEAGLWGGSQVVR